MTEDVIETISRDPRYAALVRSRERFSWLLSAIVLFVYFGFILTIAFDKAILAQPIGSGVASLGVILGFGIILLSIVLTGIYVHRANKAYDAAISELVREYGK